MILQDQMDRRMEEQSVHIKVGGRAMSDKERAVVGGLPRHDGVELDVWKTYECDLLESLAKDTVGVAPDYPNELMHDLYLQSALDQHERIGMLRIRPVAQTIDGQGVVAPRAGKRLPVVVVTEAEA